MGKWISIKEYKILKNLKSPQVVYEQIAKNKFKGKWRKVKIEKERYEVWYE